MYFLMAENVSGRLGKIKHLDMWCVGKTKPPYMMVSFFSAVILCFEFISKGYKESENYHHMQQRFAPNWQITAPTRMFPRDFIHNIKLRCGLLLTKVRRSRGNQNPDDLLCWGGYAKPEALSYILQSCAVTHDSICKRHDNAVNFVVKHLLNRGTICYNQSRIPLPTAFCKLDIIVVIGETAFVHCVIPP